MKPEMKKLIIANLPYLLFVYLFGKLGQAYRLAEGIDLSQKLLHFADGCAAAFESAAPSFHPTDLLIGVAGAAALRLILTMATLRMGIFRHRKTNGGSMYHKKWKPIW